MSRGALTSLPRRRARQIVLIGALWLVSLVALVAWWTSVVHSQSAHIVELEVASGVARDVAESAWSRRRLMLMGESVAFFVLVFGASAVLAWFYWRETVRTRALSTFFASITHELRTPLASLTLQAEALAEKAAPAHGELPHRLLEDVARLENQVERMLELARVEGGGAVLDENVPLGTALHRLLERVRESLPGKVDLTIPAVLPDLTVRGDRVAIDMILRNLVDNSLRHGGRANVAVVMYVETSASTVSLRCVDNGVGSGDAGRLGGLFVRGERSQGAGIGLYLIRTLMTQMGGSASYETRAGGGFIAHLQFRRGEAYADA